MVEFTKHYQSLVEFWRVRPKISINLFAGWRNASGRKCWTSSDQHRWGLCTKISMPVMLSRLENEGLSGIVIPGILFIPTMETTKEQNTIPVRIQTMDQWQSLIDAIQLEPRPRSPQCASAVKYSNVSTTYVPVWHWVACALPTEQNKKNTFFK